MSAGVQGQHHEQDGIAVLEAEIQGLLESLLELGVCEFDHSWSPRHCTLYPASWPDTDTSLCNTLQAQAKSILLLLRLLRMESPLTEQMIISSKRMEHPASLRVHGLDTSTQEVS